MHKMFYHLTYFLAKGKLSGVVKTLNRTELKSQHCPYGNL